MAARRPTFFELALTRLISAARRRWASHDGAPDHRAGASGPSLEDRVERLEQEIAALRASSVAQEERAQRKLRAALSSAVNLLSLVPHLKIDGVLPPFPHQGFEITGETAAFLFHLVRRNQPRLIVELGSGSSTVLLAAAQRANGAGRVVSIEHDREHAKRTAQFLHQAELSDWVELIETPLVESTFGALTLQWYDVGGLLGGLAQPIDLVLVDGPPGKLQALSRYPALPVLLPHLSPQALIFVDDGTREDESRMIELWRELGATFQAEPLGFLPRFPVLLRMGAEAAAAPR